MQNLLTFFSAKNISIYAILVNDGGLNDMLTNELLVLNNWAQKFIYLFFFFLCGFSLESVGKKRGKKNTHTHKKKPKKHRHMFHKKKKALCRWWDFFFYDIIMYLQRNAKKYMHLYISWPQLY